MNYKIKVGSEAESKEAQELFFEFGYVWHDTKCKTQMRYVEPVYYSSFDDMELACDVSDVNYKHKEITMAQLRDLVVLKRNDVGDATHTDGHYSFYVEKDKNYFFSSCDKAWRDTWKNVDILKPIEKKEMKEYLRKNNDGEYILEVTDEREAQEPHAKHWIEVPKGCDYLISVFGANSFIDIDMFAKVKPKNVLWSRKPMKEYLNPNQDYKLVTCKVGYTPIPSNWIEVPEGSVKAYLNNSNTINFVNIDDDYMNSQTNGRWINTHRGQHEACGHVLVWQRKETLNDKVASAETARQADKVLKEILEGGGSAWDTQVGGDHYKKYKIQPMEFALKNNLNPLQHSVLKYVMRHEDKNGKQDLEKAKHYIDLMIEYYYGDS